MWNLPADVARGREHLLSSNSCCQEQNLEAVAVEQLEEPPGCIVYHSGFQAVFLNVWGL